MMRDEHRFLQVEPERIGAEQMPAIGAHDVMRLGILAYLCVLVGRIEGRRVRRWEVLGMLERTRRQHRMVRTR